MVLATSQYTAISRMTRNLPKELKMICSAMIWAIKIKSFFVGDNGPSREALEATATGNSPFDVRVGLSMSISSDSLGCLINADGGIVEDGGFRIASSSSMRSYCCVSSAQLQPLLHYKISPAYSHSFLMPDYLQAPYSFQAKWQQRSLHHPATRQFSYQRTCP